MIPVSCGQAKEGKSCLTHLCVVEVGRKSLLKKEVEGGWCREVVKGGGADFVVVLGDCSPVVL